jgi:hypothetical protein
MTVLRFTRLLAIVAVLAPAVGARAQGTLSTQGFGYPLGGLSTRAAASGGASGEFDNLSSRNPAALSRWFRSGLYVQYDPEIRTVSAGDAEDQMTTPRFGAIAAGFAFGERMIIGVSSNSFLDRSFATSVRSGARLGGDSVLFTESFASNGAIGDSRLGVSYAFGSRLFVGAGVHVYTGENRLALTRLFDDSVRFGTLDRRLTLSYTGTAASAGIIVTPVNGFSIAASARQGGTMRLRVGDTLRTEANVPNRFGVGVRLDAITGLALFAGADRNEWSRMSTLGSPESAGVDGWEYSGGAEFTGQPPGTPAAVYSLGYRRRDLPFRAAGAIVSEQVFSGGTSLPLARGRAMLDFAVQRANRDATAGVRERAWLFSVGFTVRP